MMNRINMLTVAFLMLSALHVRGETKMSFKLTDLKSNQVQLSDLLADGPVLLDFWATWCKPCAKAFPKLNALHKKYEKQGLRVVGINEDGPRSQSKVKPFVRSLKIKFPVLIDKNSEVMRQFQVQSLPTTILIAPDGTIKARHVGYKPDAMKKLEQEIEALLESIHYKNVGEF